MNITNKSNDHNKTKINMTMIIWLIMTFVSIFNIIFIILYYFKLKSNKLNNIYILTLIYVLVCSIRAIWLKNVTERICLFDFPLSSPLLDRFISTFSELSFILVNIIVIKYIVENVYFLKIKYVLIAKLVIIIIAEIFSWIGVLLQNYFYTFIEESFWTLFGILNLIVYILFLIKYYSLKKNNNYLLKLFIPVIIFNILFLYYMFKYDLPNWLNKWNYYNNKEITFFSNNFYQKIIDMLYCDKKDNNFEIWKDDLLFYFLYFIFAVWACIYLLIFSNNYLFK